MQATSPTFYGTVTLNGSIVCAPTTGRKIDIYSDGATIYGFGLNDFEFCVFGGAGSAFSYRIAKEGATDLAGDLALFVNSTGVGIPVGRPISWGANTLLVDATGALLVNGAAAVSRAGAVTLAFDPGAVAADGTYVLVGGAPLNEEFGRAIGADAYCRDAAVAVETAKEYIARKHNQLAQA